MEKTWISKDRRSASTVIIILARGQPIETPSIFLYSGALNENCVLVQQSSITFFKVLLKGFSNYFSTVYATQNVDSFHKGYISEKRLNIKRY